MTKDEINKRLAALLKKADTNADKLLAAYEKNLTKAYKHALVEIKKEIAAMYEKYGDDVDYAQMVSYNRLTNLEQQIAGEIKKLTNENIKTTTNAIKDIYSEQYYQSGFAFEQSLGMRLGFGLLNPDVIKASVLNSLDRITWPDRMKDHAQQFTKQIYSELTQGLIQGKGYGKIAAAITDKTGINAGKVLRIVRTEGHRVQNAAGLLAYDKTQSATDRLGLKTVKIWVATLDNRTRDSHGAMDGQEADSEGMFTFPGGDKTPAPGIQGPPEEVINCVLAETNIISPKIRNVTKRYYEGDLIEIKTIDNTITASPEHPILTQKGFIPFNLVNQDDKIINCFFSKDFPSANPYENNRPSQIIKIFDLADIIGLPKRTCKSSPKLDSNGVDSNIDIISTFGFLWDWIESLVFKNINNEKFSIANLGKCFLFSNSRLNHFLLRTLAPFACFVASLKLKRSLFGVHIFPFNKLRFALGASIDTIVAEDSCDNITRNIEFFCKSIFGNSVKIGLNDVVSIRKFHFSGHIFNLETVNEFYLASNLQKDNGNYNILHNCRCVTRMQFKDFPQKFRRDNETKKIIEYQSYADWKKAKGIE